MSGRGLGHTGGTIDKLEAVDGFHVEITEQEFTDIVNRDKVAVIGQSGNLTPADKKLYALRDVTATVNSIPLIASSIMSKKIAAGADAIVLDVKTGDGAFMKDEEDAVELARAMVSIGNNVGRNTMAIISSMSEPLGYAIGNALEVKEAIDTLKGEGPEDLTALCLELGAQMAVLGGAASSLDEAKDKLRAAIDNGEALEKFRVFLKNQGGDASVVDDPSKLPQAEYQFEVKAEESGFVEEIAAEEIGIASAMLGAGRQTKEDEIDLAVGLVLKKKVGDRVEQGDTLAVIHSNSEDIREVEQKIIDNYRIGSRENKIELIKQIITE
jgi:pyrimidine-nucleoside phosphorylase